MAEPFLDRYSHKIIINGECHEWVGGKNGNGYGRVSINGKMHYVHRLAFEEAFGTIPDGLLIDHICHNRCCVNTKHLRLANGQQNMANRSGLDAHNTSGFRGVSWHKRRNKWQARVQANGVSKTLGYFTEIEDAVLMVRTERLRLFGEYAGKDSDEQAP